MAYINVDVTLEEFETEELLKELASRESEQHLIHKHLLEALYRLTCQWFTDGPDMRIANDVIEQAHDLCRDSLGKAL